MASLMKIDGKASTPKSAASHFCAASLNGQIRNKLSSKANTIYTFKVNHSVYDDDNGMDDVLSILYIGIAKFSVCPTGREKLISSSGNDTIHDDNTTLISLSSQWNFITKHAPSTVVGIIMQWPQETPVGKTNLSY